MGFRFQRRVKIAPGLNLVASKSGIGISAGVRGARMSATPSGIFGHGGLPGTGLAYREKLNKKGRSTSSSATNRRGSGASGETMMLNVTVRLEDSGEVSLSHQNGDSIPQDVQDKLKRAAKAQLRAVLEDHCAKHNQEVLSLTQVHLGTPAPTIKPVFVPREFDADKPVQPPDLKGTLWTMIWPPAKRQLAAENLVRKQGYEAELGDWTAAREAFLSGESARKERELRGVFTDLEVMTDVLADHLGRIPWPQETEVGFDLGEDSRTIAVELSLPKAESFPCEEWSVHGNQLRILKKKLAVTRGRKIYSDYVHGVALRVLGEVFARLPTVQVGLVTGVVPQIDPASGQEVDVALFSVMATRDEFTRINFAALKSIDPAESLTLFDLRRDMTKTAIFRPVNPITIEELDSGTGSC